MGASLIEQVKNIIQRNLYITLATVGRDGIPSPRRIYKAVPEKVWISVDAEEYGYFVDKRVELRLEDLRQ